MKDLSITQEYLICVVNEKGVLSPYNSKAVVCMVVSGILEMQLEHCISIEDEKIIVCGELPEHIGYLKPLYDAINQHKAVKIKTIIGNYLISLTGGKKQRELFNELMDSLKKADVVEPIKTGLLGKKENFVPKKEVITSIVEKLRAELLEEGEVSEEVIVLTALLENADCLKKYFSKFEQKELKNKIKEIKNSEAGTTTKEMIQYVEVWSACIYGVIASVSG